MLYIVQCTVYSSYDQWHSFGSTNIKDYAKEKHFHGKVCSKKSLNVSKPAIKISSTRGSPSLHKNVPSMTESLLYCIKTTNVREVSWIKSLGGREVPMYVCIKSLTVIVKKSRKTFYLLRNYDAYSGPINLVPLLGGKNWEFCPPLPYLWLSAHADHLILWIQMTSCFTKQLLPGNLHYRLENSCYPNSSWTGTFCTSL